LRLVLTLRATTRTSLATLSSALRRLSSDWRVGQALARRR
jgi:hypothetical protein